MHLGSSRLMFDVVDLYNIDNNIKFTQNELQLEYDGLMHRHLTDALGLPPFILASLTSKQVEAEKFLLANDFKKIGMDKINPNTCNRVSIFLRMPLEPKMSPKTKASYDYWVSNYKTQTSSPYAKQAYIAGANISCSTLYLANPEHVTHEYFNGTDTTPPAWRPQCAFIITAIAASNTEKRKILEDNNFFKVAEGNGYVSANDQIVLYMRYVSIEERKLLKCATTHDLDGRTKE